MATPAMLTSPSWAEVFYDFLRVGGEEAAEQAVRGLLGLGTIVRDDLDTAFWKEIARLKAGPNPSFADCFCVALARRLAGKVLTGDHDDYEPLGEAGVCEPQFIRERQTKRRR